MVAIQYKTLAQALTYARRAGFTDAQAEVMAALTQAETPTVIGGVNYSNFAAVGDLHLVNRIYGPSYGGGQVRAILAQAGTGSYRDPVALAAAATPATLDPDFQARAWRSIYAVQGFRAWSTYVNGAYLAYMLEAKFNPKPQLPPSAVIVRAGDTLSAIGSRTGVSWQDIAAINSIPGPSYTIYIGNVLLLPEFDYTVASGDNLTVIARDQGQDLTWYALWQYNIKTVPNPDRLALGQVLKIPRTPPTTPAPAPA